MDKRDAINEILLSLNELPLDIEDAVEDIQVAVIVDKQLDITKRKILASGWFFNTTVITLVPNTEEYIVIPQSFLSVDGTTDKNLTVRDWKLFDKEKLTYKFEDSQECNVIEDISFDDIPFMTADYIVQVASLQSYINIIGNTEDIAVRNQMVAMSRIEALREDANNIDGNLLGSQFVTSLIDRTSL